MVKEEENSIYVGGLPWETDACDLEAAFSRFGSILETKVMVEKNGRSRGFGYVTFTDRSKAYDAIRQMNCTMLGRRCVSVQVARRSRFTYEEPSYASFSCRGPYGEVDCSTGDVCFSCEGLGKLHDWPALGDKTDIEKLPPASAEETSIVHGASESSCTGSESSYSSEGDGEDSEEIPETFSDSISNDGVESEIVVEDPGYLLSVVSTFSRRGYYAGRDGRVGEGDCSLCGSPLHWACNCSPTVGDRQFSPLPDKDDDPSDVDVDVDEDEDSDSDSDSDNIVRHEDGSVSLHSKVDETSVVLDSVSLFEGVKDCPALAKVFELRPSTFRKVPKELSPRFRCLVLNEFSLFLSDLGKIDLKNLNEETFCTLLLTLGDLRNNKLEVDWLEQRLRAMHGVSEVTRANARLKELEAELLEVERRAKEIELEKSNVKTTIDKHGGDFSQHSFDVNGNVGQDLF